MTLNEALLQLARDLKDAAPGREFTAYSRELLLQWWNDGLCLLGRLRPDVFSTTRIVTLKPGAQQEVVGCEVFGQVVAFVNTDGTETPVRRTSYTASLSWTKPSCRVLPKDYRVSSYRFDPTQKRTFYVDPPVPPGREVKVRVTCSGAPEALDLADLDEPVDLDCYQFAMTKHYVLAQAYAQDSDQTNLPLAQFHLGLWNGFLGGGARADAAFSGGSITVTPPAQAAAGARR